MRDRRPWGEPLNIAIDVGSEDFDPEDGERARRLPRVMARMDRENPEKRESLPVRFLKGLRRFVFEMFFEGCAAGCSAMIVLPIVVTIVVYSLS